MHIPLQSHLTSGNSPSKSDEVTHQLESLTSLSEQKPKRKTWQEILQARFRYDPETGKLFLRRTGKEAVGIDQGYKRVNIGGTIYKTHRIIWEMHYGPIPNNKQIDHINHNRIDNRLENLRLTNFQGNTKNQKIYRNNSSGIMGVRKILRKDGLIRWQVDMRVCGKLLHFGRHKSFFEACCIRKSAENKYNFHPNHGKTLT